MIKRRRARSPTRTSKSGKQRADKMVSIKFIKRVQKPGYSIINRKEKEKKR